ncbi:hypothetical protein HPB51_003943 [Rhipicephalus microplus]|uniref:Uncharacterized protein n=1 Tax=Rhipicephalus microplus TaxID=6941 RepID=A0A9J6EQ90_RHIMP|nr:hypothetical protein HPB51_003943 [Rhipicephalus microplus]
MSYCNWSCRLYRRRLDSRYGNCYCLNCHGQEQHNASIFNYHTVSAPNAGLTLTLDVQPQEYLPTSTAMGFLVMVHGRGFRADACADSVFAQPGYITYIGLIQDCLKICHQEMIRSRCKCESQNLPFSSREDRLKTPVCGGWDVDHYKELSFAAIPQDFHSNQTTVRKRFLAQVVVYFKTLTFESVASVPKYDNASDACTQRNHGNAAALCFLPWSPPLEEPTLNAPPRGCRAPEATLAGFAGERSDWDG